MAARVWVGRVVVPESVEMKLRTRRGITGAQVRAAWHEHPEHGRRLVVVAEDEQGRVLKVVLQPIDVADGSWRLRTAVLATR